MSSYIGEENTSYIDNGTVIDTDYLLKELEEMLPGQLSDVDFLSRLKQAQPPPTQIELDYLLITAIWHNHLGPANVLLANGASPNAEDQEGLTPLMLVIKNLHDSFLSRGNLERLFDVLLTSRTVNQQTKQSQTALMYASQVFNGLDYVQKLLQAGAQIDLLDHDGKSALDYALKSRNYAIAELLLENGSKIHLDDAVVLLEKLMVKSTSIQKNNYKI